jgi:hypothetical protein
VPDDQDKIGEGVQPHLDDGERLLATLQGQPRGHTTAAATTGIAKMIGGRQVRKQREAADAAGLVVKSPMGLALTDRRLLTLEISTTKGFGKATGVTDVLSAVPLADVTGVAAKRVGLAGVLVVAVRGAEFKIETPSVGRAKAFAEAWQGTRATA